MKQRLIGAVVLVALAVIFLPMLIKGPAPDSGVSDVSLKVPDEPKGDFVEIPLTPDGTAPAGGAVGMNTGAPSPLPSDSTPAAAAPAGAPMLPATVAGGDYAVSFGAYASAADADAVIARLKQARLPGFSEAATINGRPAWRVRIGPYADRAQAEIVRLEAVKVRNDVNAQVVALDATAPAATAAAQPSPPPAAAKPAPAKPAESAKPVAATPPPPPAAAKPAEAPKPATPPAASATGFAVQLGAFTNAADANALRDKVRAGGFSAFVEQVRTDKGTLNRVRVGPVANRADADALKAQVASKVGVSGMVRPHP